MAGLHAGALAAVVLAALPGWPRLLLAAAVAASAWRNLRRDARRVCAMTLRADGKLETERADGLRREASVLAQSTVVAWLIVLLLRCEGGRESMIILPDALSAEDFRRLRLWLRWRAELN